MNYSFGVTHIDTDGDSVTPSRLRNGVSAEDDNYENWTTSARLGIALSDTLEVNFFGRYIDSETDLDPELFDPAFAGGTTEDRDARLDQTEYLAHRFLFGKVAVEQFFESGKVELFGDEDLFFDDF